MRWLHRHKGKLLIIFVPWLCLLLYFGQYELMAKRMKREGVFPPQQINSIKHALAAYELYSALRMLGYAPDEAVQKATWLGELNEHAERFTKRRNPDPLQEVMKDMHNNYVGIRAAYLREKKPLNADNAMSNKVLIILLSREGALLNSRGETVRYAMPANAPIEKVERAKAWLHHHRAEVDQQLNFALWAASFATQHKRGLTTGVASSL